MRVFRWCGFLVLAARVWGCSCAGWPTAREAWEESTLVFAGRVERAHGMPVQRVTLRVDEAFKGVSNAEHVELRQPITSCTGEFQEGQEILFYLFPAQDAGTWVIRGCHRSRRVKDAADDFLFLRALPGSAKRTRISGDVHVFQGSGLAGVPVTIQRDEGPPVKLVTNVDGVYEVYGLPAGTYKISIEMPARMRLRFPMRYGRQQKRRSFEGQELVLPEGGSAEMSFVLTVDNRMSGRVLDKDGNPMKNACIDLEPVSSNSAKDLRVFGCSKEGGRYTLEDMPAGQYRLVSNREDHPTAHQPYHTVYFPGTTDKEKAAIVTIQDGEHIDNLDVRIPALVRTIQLNGRMQFSDGVPIPGAWVEFVGSSGKYREREQSQADGSFRISIVAGMAGSVEGDIWVDRESAAKCPEFDAKFNPNGWMSSIRAIPVPVSGNADESGLVLKLAVPFCRGWQNFGARGLDRARNNQ